MSDFKAKMHQIRFRLGLHPRPRWGSLQRSPDPLAGFKGPTSKGREGRGREGERKGKEGVRKRKGEGKGEGRGSVPLALILQFDHCQQWNLFLFSSNIVSVCC